MFHLLLPVHGIDAIAYLLGDGRKEEGQTVSVLHSSSGTGALLHLLRQLQLAGTQRRAGLSQSLLRFPPVRIEEGNVL